MDSLISSGIMSSEIIQSGFISFAKKPSLCVLTICQCYSRPNKSIILLLIKQYFIINKTILLITFCTFGGNLIRFVHNVEWKFYNVRPHWNNGLTRMRRISFKFQIQLFGFGSWALKRWLPQCQLFKHKYYAGNLINCIISCVLRHV